MKTARTDDGQKNVIARIFFYILGICTLALGLTLSTKTKLGASAIIAVAFSISEISGIQLGDATFILYCFFIAVEIVLHLLPGKRAPSDKRKALIIDVLQLPFSVFFTRLLNVYAAWIPVPEQLPVRITVLVLAIVLIGVGAALTLDMRLVASPGDGIVQAISDRSGLELGLTKNIVDVCCVVFTCLLTLVCVRHIIGIGIGTLAGMLGTGRVIAIFNRMFGAYLIPLGKRD
jgi:uncharacterized membrane protein YczE